MTQIAAYLNKEFFDSKDAFATAKSLGFDYVEIPGMVFSPPEDLEGRKKLAEKLERHNLKARWHTSPSHNTYFGSSDAFLRRKNIDQSLWELSFVHEMGWEMFIIHPGQAEIENDRQRAYEALRIINEKTVELNIQLELENASGVFNGHPHELVRICEEVPGLKITFDCSHAYRSTFCQEGEGSIVDHLSIIKPFTNSFQFNDYNGTKNCTVGEGILPWDELMPIILSIPCDVWAIELNSIEETVKTRDFLKSKFITIGGKHELC